MTNPVGLRGLILRLGRQMAGAPVVLAVLLLQGVVPTQAAQAQTFTVLYTFTGGADGSYPVAGLFRDAVGSLYGTTDFGGAFNAGVVFKVDKKGREKVLYTFTGGADGGHPVAGLIGDAAGSLYGTTRSGGVSGAGVVFRLGKDGKESVLYSFTGQRDGGTPYAGVIRDTLGTLYGTTETGGDLNQCAGSGCGVVFKLDKHGKETVLYTFTYVPDGAFPTGLIRDATGALYGTTVAGGDSNCHLGQSCGVVFKVNNNGKETTLYTFTSPAEGAFPQAGLISDRFGNLYGTTSFGGDVNLDCGGGEPPGCGVVFSLNKKGTEKVLYAFTDKADGGLPQAGLIGDAMGSLYGTTSHGGQVSCGFRIPSCGVVFKLDKDGQETVLHAFTGGSDGRFPLAGLIRDRQGNLYGTTAEGGDVKGQNCSPSGCGVVFKIAP